MTIIGHESSKASLVYIKVNNKAGITGIGFNNIHFENDRPVHTMIVKGAIGMFNITNCTFKGISQNAFINYNSKSKQAKDKIISPAHIFSNISRITQAIRVSKSSYKCIRTHVANPNNKPGHGKNWKSYWVKKCSYQKEKDLY